MKIPSSLLIAGFAISLIAPANAQPPQAEPAPTAARLLDELPDGTPPTPEPPKPEFIVPAEDILESETHQEGGREITIQKIAPIDLPPPPEPAAPPVPITPEFQASIDAYQAAHPKSQTIHLGGTIYRSNHAATRSRVTYWPAGEPPVTFWSSADFSLLSGFANFADSQGDTRTLLMMWSAVDRDRLAAVMTKRGQPYQPLAIPEFPAGKATFAIVEGDPSAACLATIQSLHDLYHNEHAKLKAAYDGREQARLAQEAELKAHPPEPKNITLNYWEIGTSTPTEGGDK